MSEDLNKLVERRKASPAGAGHYHIADLYPYEMRISIAGQQVAQSTRAIVLKEVGKSLYNPSFYVPAADVDLGLFEREAGHSTHCHFGNRVRRSHLVIQNTENSWELGTTVDNTARNSISRSAGTVDTGAPFKRKLGNDHRTRELSYSARTHDR